MLDWITRRTVAEKPDPYLHMAAAGLLITGQSGFLSGTHVASNLGWRDVRNLSVGDKVLTFDHGMQRVVDIQRETLILPEGVPTTAQTPVRVPKDALNNRAEMWLMPELGLLVESEYVTDGQGDPYAVVPARALDGFDGIERAVPGARLNLTTLAFAGDEVVYVDGGMLCHCPRPREILTGSQGAEPPLYRVLDMEPARALLRRVFTDHAMALICDPEEVAEVTDPTLQRHKRPLLA